MDTHLAISAETTLDSHEHNWQPIDGWRARYRCRDCGVIARKPRLVTPPDPWGLKPPKSTEITPYACTLKCEGLRCGCPAVKKVGRRRWRCSAHLSSSPASHTNAARLVLARPLWDDLPDALLPDGVEHPVEQPSAA